MPSQLLFPFFDSFKPERRMIVASRPRSNSPIDDFCNQFAPQSGLSRQSPILKPMSRAGVFWKSFQT